MIPEREREALMRLTMCAREECRICMYQKRCNFDFQYELATKNMNILADALRADRKTENSSEKPNNSTISKMEQVDEPQTEDFKACVEGLTLLWIYNYVTDDEFHRIDARLKCKGEPQTDYNKSLELFAEVLFDKEKSEQFLKECKAMGIEPQTDCCWK